MMFKVGITMVCIVYHYHPPPPSFLQALVSNEEFERTKEIVAEFGKPGGVGEQLQKELMEKAKTSENWV